MSSSGNLCWLAGLKSQVLTETDRPLHLGDPGKQIDEACGVSKPDPAGDQHSRVAVRRPRSTLELVSVQSRRRLLIGGCSCVRRESHLK